MIWTSLNRYRDIGLLVLRIGIGVMFIFHGYPKISGGPAMWGKIGTTVEIFGIHFVPVFWGFMSSFTEFFGGIFLISGFFFRPITVMMTINMIVATSMHLSNGQGLAIASHAIEDGILFLSLILIGPGKYSLDELFKPYKQGRSDILI
ncbi:MAG TPA: DoxX family protein [Terriglobales bacterium]|nr:DoxX family protein [Terriglobales bacterium]